MFDSMVSETKLFKKNIFQSLFLTHMTSFWIWLEPYTFLYIKIVEGHRIIPVKFLFKSENKNTYVITIRKAHYMSQKKPSRFLLKWHYAHILFVKFN
jgi:hypothetical protein